MKLTETGPPTRRQLADLLVELANNLVDDGSAKISGVKVDVPEAIATKLKFRQKEGRAKFKISLSWPASPADVPETPLISHFRLPEAAPTNFKQLKKELQQSLFYFKRLVSEGAPPTPDELAKYRRLQAAFRDAARPEWLEGLAETDLAMEDMVMACNRGDLAGAGQAINRLIALKEKYHALFK